MEKEMDKFWLVWGGAFRLPTIRHDTKHMAKVEATRLSLNNPGHIFYVLESLGYYKKEDALWTPHTLQKTND